MKAGGPSARSAFRLARYTQVSSEVPGVRDEIRGSLIGYVVISGLSSRIRSCRKARWVRPSYPIAHGLQPQV